MNNDMNQDIIDTAILQEYTPTLVNKLIAMFQEQAPQSIAKLKHFATEKNAEKISKEAHYLKGSCSALGGTQLAAICKQLQLKGEKGDLNNVETLIEQLDQSYAQSMAILKRLC
ncbi:MAG: Hpt domain-containing protein [Candidatus Competibacteraceae bacterium]|nr:Hpt domain-containing protein [Candidatus Competibacteraceae bacterium]